MGTTKEGDQRQRREVKANRFATLMLMPPHLLRKAMAAFPGADLLHVLALARAFAVAKETAARAYVQYHSGRIAIVVAGNGRVQLLPQHSSPAIVGMANSPILLHLFYAAGERGYSSCWAFRRLMQCRFKPVILTREDQLLLQGPESAHSQPLKHQNH